MKIAICGGGIFGVSIAWVLAKNNFSVNLFEKENDILQAASNINQYRLHQGYHYPRSRETILQSMEGKKHFEREYGGSLFGNKIQHYYSFAKYNSLVTPEECIKMWNSCNLTHTMVENVNLVNNEQIHSTAIVNEDIFDPVALRKICWEKLNKYGVNVILNKEAKKEDLEGYDLVVVATYSQNNKLLEDYPESQREYQFELCEKPVLRLPEKFKNKSIVVVDGPFACIAPFGNTGLFVMGHVVHAIHKRTIGKLPEIPKEFLPLINKGVVKNPPITNIKKFIEDGAVLFPDLKEAEHIGSMFTIRTVPPNRDHDDARPTFVERIGKNIISVFSGKIGTCINAAEQVLSIANNIKNDTDYKRL
jgi:hypothetical protein